MNLEEKCEKIQEEIKKLEEKEKELKQKKKELQKKQSQILQEMENLRLKKEQEKQQKIYGILKDSYGEISENQIGLFEKVMKEQAAGLVQCRERICEKANTSWNKEEN